MWGSVWHKLLFLWGLTCHTAQEGCKNHDCPFDVSFHLAFTDISSGILTVLSFQSTSDSQAPGREAGGPVLSSPGSLAQDCPGQYCSQSSLVGNGGFWEGLNLADSHSSVMKMFTTILLPTCTGFLTPLTSLLQHLQFNSVLTLSTWRKPQIPWVRGPVPQDFSPHFKSQAQVVACF